MMLKSFKDVAVLRHGDAEGNRMVVRLTTNTGIQIHAIAVPQDNSSRTGPTWTYLFDNDGLTLIDAGAFGSFHALADGIAFAGFRLIDIERVIVTHGHWDHDGAAGEFSLAANAELWAHDIYPHLLQYDPWDIQRRAVSPIHEEMQRIARADMERNQAEVARSTSGYRSRREAHIQARKAYRVHHGLRDDETQGRLHFMHAPGHSPDEICVTLDGVVFTGDHVLPEITPHPTTKARYSPEIKQSLPSEYHDEDKLYGLATYMKSLKRVADLGENVAVLPAHRLFNKGKFNFETVARANEIMVHHEERLGRILHRIGQQGAMLEDITRGIFARRKLIGGNLYAALSEVVAHIELLEDTGDLEIDSGLRLRWTGSENYRQLLRELGRA